MKNYPTQSNTNPAGPRTFNSGEDLTDKEGRLIKLTDGGSVAEFKLPTAVTDLCLFVCVDGGEEDEPSVGLPLIPGEETRVRANGAGSAGDVLILETIAGANIGKSKTATGAAAGVYFSPGTAAEDFADEQLVKINPLPRLHLIAPSVAAPAAMLPANGVFAALNSTAVNPTKNDFDALLAQCEILRDTVADLSTVLADLRTKEITAGTIVAP